jgi:hypothetical protein
MTKFPQLPMGQRFRWRGAVYRKSGPLTAQAEDGSGQQMVPRSALVEPLDATDDTAGSMRRRPDPATIRAALDDLLKDLEAAVDGLAEPDAEHFRTALAQARKAFIARVGL